MSASSLTFEIAATAARLIVEEGMEYGPAKRKAAKLLSKRGLPAGELPDNDLIEEEVRAYIDIFCADTQPTELAALREVALRWMERLAEFQPHLTGAVWNGTATRLNDVWINLFCDDPKSAEIRLIDRGVDYDVGTTVGFRGEQVDVLTVSERSAALGERVLVHLVVYDRDDLRGAVRPGARGRAERGNTEAVRALLGERA